MTNPVAEFHTHQLWSWEKILHISSWQIYSIYWACVHVHCLWHSQTTKQTTDTFCFVTFFQKEKLPSWNSIILFWHVYKASMNHWGRKDLPCHPAWLSSISWSSLQPSCQGAPRQFSNTSGVVEFSTYRRSPLFYWEVETIRKFLKSRFVSLWLLYNHPFCITWGKQQKFTLFLCEMPSFVPSGSSRFSAKHPHFLNILHMMCLLSLDHLAWRPRGSVSITNT